MLPETQIDPFALAEARLAGLRTLAEDGAALASILDAEAQIAQLRSQLASGQTSPADVAATLGAIVQRAERSALLAPQHAIALNLTEARNRAASFLTTSDDELNALWQGALDEYGEDVTNAERRRLEALRQEELAAIEAGDLHAAFEARTARLDLMEDVFVRNGDEARAEEVRDYRAETEQQQAQLRDAEARDASVARDAENYVGEARFSAEDRMEGKRPFEADAQLLIGELGLTDLPDGAEVAPCAAPSNPSASCRSREA